MELDSLFVLAGDDEKRLRRAALLIDLAKASGAKAMVTTEKDWVKWSVLLEGQRVAVPIYRVDLAISFSHGEQALQGLLNKALMAA